MSSSGESNFAFSGITRTRQSAPDGYRVAEHRTLLGTGPGTRDRAMAEIMQWGVKRRAGFRVTAGAVVPGAEFVISMGPIREPVRVSWVAENGFGYATLVGHPLSGEEAFVVEVDDLQSRVDDLKGAGLRFRNDIVVGPGGKQILLEDPDNNVVELFEPAR